MTELDPWIAQAITLRRDLHKHPELAFQEHRTAAMVAEGLHAAGLEVRTGIAGTGVVGILRGDRPGKTIAWRADMDALPIHEAVDLPFASVHDGVMHACGHDGHTAIGLTLARLLATSRAELEGTRVFLFQPAEETFEGAQPMIDAGVLDDPHVDELYGLHLTTGMAPGDVGVRPGPMWSSADGFEITVRGSGGHGAYPHLTVDPIATAAQLVNGLPGLVARETSAEKVAVLSIGEFHAGSAYNIIPETAVLRGSLRTLDDDVRNGIRSRLEAYATGIAGAHRAEAEVSWLSSCCPCLVNHEAPARLVHQCAAETEGEDRVAAVSPSLASDDMSLFLRHRPGCYFKVGCAPAGKSRPHHSPIFAIDEAGIAVSLRVGARVMRAAGAGSE